MKKETDNEKIEREYKKVIENKKDTKEEIKKEKTIEEKMLYLLDSIEYRQRKMHIIMIIFLVYLIISISLNIYEICCIV